MDEASGGDIGGVPCRAAIMTPVMAPAVMRRCGSSAGGRFNRVASASVINSMVWMYSLYSAAAASGSVYSSC